MKRILILIIPLIIISCTRQADPVKIIFDTDFGGDADDLAAHGLPHPVAPETARQRRDILMEVQKAISESRLARYLDRELTVLVEEAPEPDVFLGRTAFQAPEVDGLTYIHAAAVQNTVAVGRFVQVRITDTLEYDLVGEPV